MDNPYDMKLITRYPNGDIIRYLDTQSMKSRREFGEKRIRRLTKKEMIAMTMLDAVMPELDPTDPLSATEYEIKGVGRIANTPWGYVSYGLKQKGD